MESIGTHTSLEIRQISYGINSDCHCVVIKQIVSNGLEKTESVITLEISHFEEMIASYQAAKPSAIAVINVLKDL